MSTPATLRQLEAIYWIAALGTFERAASKLNTTQSAISKRIQELEGMMGTQLFDRSQRGARLTEKGEHLVSIATEMIALQGRINDIRDGAHVPVRTIRFGVTELVAITWLPKMIRLLTEHYPNVILEPEVGLSRNLFERLLEGSVDLVISPVTFTVPEITALHLADVTNGWMAKPGLVSGVAEGRTLSLAELAEYRILSQGNRSGSGLFFHKWLRNHGVELPLQIASDSMLALLGLTIAGLGLSYMPKDCFRPLVAAGNVEFVPTDPALPSVPYAAMYRNDLPSATAQAIAQLALTACDFSAPFSL